MRTRTFSCARLARLTILAALACVLTPSRLYAEAPFADLTFEAASSAAERQGKLLMVDFYTTWCPPCKMLDKTTWKDAQVCAWLEKHTIALKVDAEKDRELSRRYGVRGYPTMVFLRPDGSEIGRLVGYRDAAAFVRESSALLAGMDRPGTGGPASNDPMARMKHARTLEQNGKLKEALEEYLWCWDQGTKHEPAFRGVRESFLLDDIKRLGAQLPAATEALKSRRDAAEKATLAGEATSRHAAELCALNRVLEEPRRSLGVFDQLKEKGESGLAARREMSPYLIDVLLADRRYADVLDGRGDVTAQVIRDIELIERMDRQAKLPKEQQKQMMEFMRGRLRADAGKFYEALLGVGQHEQAERIAERLLLFDAASGPALLEHARRAGANGAVEALTKRIAANEKKS